MFPEYDENYNHMYLKDTELFIALASFEDTEDETISIRRNVVLDLIYKTYVYSYIIGSNNVLDVVLKSLETGEPGRRILAEEIEEKGIEYVLNIKQFLSKICDYNHGDKKENGTAHDGEA